MLILSEPDFQRGRQGLAYLTALLRSETKDYPTIRKVFVWPGWRGSHDQANYEHAHHRYAMNHDRLCDPVPGVEVDGFNFFRDQNGSVIARCCWCFVGFELTAENAATVRSMMIMHLRLVHRLREAPDRHWAAGK